MNNKAVFAGTFDPFTVGHYELASAASKIFDEIIVAVALSEKQCRFSLEERMEIAKRSVSLLKNVTVMSFSGFLTDFMKEVGAKTFIRGLRNTIDFEYEKNLLNAYKSFDNDIEGVYLMPSPALSHVSSSLVREVLSLGGDVSALIKPEAAKLIK